METYAKLSSKLITSSLWATETPEAKVLWITLLAMKDRNGNVSGTVPGLARLAGISIDDTETALKRFQEPDPYSRTKDHDGRRLVPTDDGWHLINHEKYRDGSGSSTERVRRYRNKQKRDETHETLRNADVTHETLRNAHTDTDTDTDNSLKLSHSREFEIAWAKWIRHRQERFEPLGGMEADAQLMELGRVFAQDADRIAAIEYSIARGAKNLIVNGDHQRGATSSAAGKTERQSRGPLLDE